MVFYGKHFTPINVIARPERSDPNWSIARSGTDKANDVTTVGISPLSLSPLDPKRKDLNSKSEAFGLFRREDDVASIDRRGRPQACQSQVVFSLKNAPRVCVWRERGEREREREKERGDNGDNNNNNNRKEEKLWDMGCLSRESERELID